MDRAVNHVVERYRRSSVARNQRNPHRCGFAMTVDQDVKTASR
jgi:hypothetical protein